uniref:Retrotransposon Copia-like N-terminal domain-containing protein n=1 Tax=Cannabis sativa TaxID=3483 RepID=A0A803Q8K3_CANSA
MNVSALMFSPNALTSPTIIVSSTVTSSSMILDPIEHMNETSDIPSSTFLWLHYSLSSHIGGSFTLPPFSSFFQTNHSHPAILVFCSLSAALSVAPMTFPHFPPSFCNFDPPHANLDRPSIYECNPYHLGIRDNSNFLIVPFQLTGEDNFQSWKRAATINLATKNKTPFIEGHLVEKCYFINEFPPRYGPGYGEKCKQSKTAKTNQASTTGAISQDTSTHLSQLHLNQQVIQHLSQQLTAGNINFTGREVCRRL